MARMLERLSEPDAETALVAAAMRDLSVFGIDLDAADFSLPRLQSTWRTMQELVRSSQTVDKALLQAALQQALDEGSLLSQLHLERLDALYPDPEACAAQVQDLAHAARGGRAGGGGADHPYRKRQMEG